MPLQQRVIEPVYVSRSTLPLPPGDIKPLIKSIAATTGQGFAANAAAAANINIVNELSCVTNGTLANLIRQLSSLSRQAEELLTGVFDEASNLLNRTVNLQHRMDALAQKVESLDQPTDVSITLRDPTNQVETFSSDMTCDQQVLSKQRMPSSVAELYHACDKPPPLNILDPYRDDGKDGLKFYTDPTYFFELWKRDMMKETAKAQQQQQQVQNNQQQQLRQQSQQLQKQNQSAKTLLNSKKVPPQHSPNQQAQLQAQQQYAKGIRQQATISVNGSSTSSTTYVSSVDANPEAAHQLYGQAPRASVHMERQMAADTIARQLPQQSVYGVAGGAPIYGMHQPQPQQQFGAPMMAPQHPPPQHQRQFEIAHGQAHQQTNSALLMQVPQAANQPCPTETPQAGNQPPMIPPPPPPALSPLPPPASPPPPPPPPPPAPPAPPEPSTQAKPEPKPAIRQPTAAELQQQQQKLRKTVPVQKDPRSDLLNAIKQGITLRRVEDSKRRVEAEKQQSMGNDVASILARRVAMQVSDSDDNGDDDDEENEWDDSSNH